MAVAELPPAKKSHPSRAGSIVAPTAVGDKRWVIASSARAAASLGREQPMVFREHDRLCARLDAELLEDPRHVIAHGLLADEELAADVDVREAGRDAHEDLALARRQAAKHFAAIGHRGTARECQHFLLEPRPGGL